MKVNLNDPKLRYSDEELNEFKLLFETKLSTAQNELKELLTERGFTSVAQAVGFAHRQIEEPGGEE
jgi:hypothetical protein